MNKFPHEFAECDMEELSLMAAWRSKRRPEKERARFFGEICAVIASRHEPGKAFGYKEFFRELFVETTTGPAPEDFESRLHDALMRCKR